MKNFKTFSFVFFLLISNYSFAQWELRNNGVSDVHTARAIDAIDSNIAVAAFRIKIYKTENAGLSWLDITPANESNFVDVSVINNLHYWVATESGKILFTSDGGINWVVQFYDNQKTNFMNYIEMFDSNNGIAMGDASNNNLPVLFLKTTDGGNNWISVNNGYLKGGASNNTWKQLDFIDMNNGYFGAFPLDFRAFALEVYKTTDGGQTWIDTHEGKSPQILKFYNEDIGIIITYGDGGGVLRSSDGLNTVDTVSNLTTFNPEDIEYFPGDPSKVYYLNYARLYFSNDSGKTWQIAFEPTNSLLGQDIVLTDKNHGWIIADGGKIYYISNNDIITDIENKDYKLPNEFILSQNYPNPFNPTTEISYQLPKASFVTLKIFDLLGKEVKSLVSEFQESGRYNVTFNANNLASGVYIYRIQAGNYTASKKLILMR